MRAVGTHRNTVIKDLVFTFLGWRHFFAKLAKIVPIPKKHSPIVKPSFTATFKIQRFENLMKSRRDQAGKPVENLYVIFYKL